MKYLVVTLLGVIVGAYAQYNYNEAISSSLLFYEAQRSGYLPADNRIPYRGNCFTDDGQSVGVDLSGGYHDAGDYVKFNFPMAFTVTVLAWSLVDAESAYVDVGQLSEIREAIRWGTDYFMKCHTSDNELWGQVGDGNADHAYWGRCEDWNQGARPAWKLSSGAPGSDLAGETAAALAAASIALRSSDSGYADRCLDHARRLYNFANSYRGKYSDSIPNAGQFYNSWSGYGDELAWAAVWLYRATNDGSYLSAAQGFYNEFGLSYTPQQFSWDDKKAGVQVLLAKVTGNGQYINDANNYINYILYSARYTPRGLVFLDTWGVLRHAANAAWICLQAADIGIQTQQCRQFAKNQIHYILGDVGHSFVCGYGNSPPQRPHHRPSSCPNRPAGCDWNDYNNPSPNPQTLTGALVGGPNDQDYWNDSRQDYVTNEVTIDYNAGFTAALAGLKKLQSSGQLP